MPSRLPDRETQVHRWIDEPEFLGRVGARHTNLSIITYRLVIVLGPGKMTQRGV